jgi:hypothetical protein
MIHGWKESAVTVIKGDPTGPVNRVRAAALLSVASRDESSSATARLHCLAAVEALGEPGAWTERHTFASPSSADARITGALQLLGQLPLDEFRRPEVLTAARHARRALRELL